MEIIASPYEPGPLSRPVAAPPVDRYFAHHGFWAPGIRALRSTHFRNQAAVLCAAILVPILLLLAWLLFMEFNDSLQARKDATRQHVEVAIGVLKWAHGQESSGALSRSEAQKAALQVISGLRYNTSDYFWIQDAGLHMVMHPIKPELDGKDLSDMKDPAGFALFRAMADVVQKDGKGFVAYQWPKPGVNDPVEKVSYVEGFQPWGWTVGSGVYVDDVRSAWLTNASMTAAAVFVSLAASTYVFWCFYRVIAGGMAVTRAHLKAITEGDLTLDFKPWGKDEAADVLWDLRNMQESLRSIVYRVRSASNEIASGCTEIAAGTSDLSHRTEKTAADLEESAASLEQISSTARHGVDLTVEASGVASKNASLAGNGGVAMQSVVQTMSSIGESSAKINEIIGTIDGIAFQTNILALNAAVEAARAGDQGRGFAVVASEVRALANRSAEAAKEIKTLIGTSVDQINAGAAVTRQAGGTIEAIVTSSNQVDRLLEELTVGVKEQQQGIAQIGQAVHSLDEMTQQNAALVEQTAAAAATMRDQANALVNEVAYFTV